MKTKEEYKKMLVFYVKQFRTIDEMTDFCVRYIIRMLEIVLQKKEIERIMTSKNRSKKDSLEALHEVLVKEVMQYNELDEMIKHLMNYVRGIVENVLEEKEREIEQFYNTEKKNANGPIKIRKKVRSATNVKTIIGPVRYKRMKYEFTYSDGTTDEYYLLDEIIGIVKGSKYSKDFIKRLVKQVVNQSYGKSSDQMKFFGSDISRQGAWNIIIDLVGKRLLEYEKNQTMELLENPENYADGKKVSTLFIELDGLFVSINDPKDRKKAGEPHKKKEMKLGKAYIGWAKRYNTESKNYKTVGTVYACGFEDVETFRLLFAGKINEIYDYYGVKQIVVNGDGAKWIFNTFKYEHRAILQLDLYHVYANITRLVSDKKLAKQCREHVAKSEFQELSDLITDKRQRSTSFSVRKDLGSLISYINNNFFYLKRHKDVDIIKVEDGLEVRGLGTMEGSIRNVLSYRLKINGVWSYTGAKIMGMLLCYYHENRLDQILDEILSEDYIGAYIGELEKEIKAYYKRERDRTQEAYRSVTQIGNLGTYEYPVKGSFPTINLKEEIIHSPIFNRFLNWK